MRPTTRIAAPLTAAVLMLGLAACQWTEDSSEAPVGGEYDTGEGAEPSGGVGIDGVEDAENEEHDPSQESDEAEESEGAVP